MAWLSSRIRDGSEDSACDHIPFDLGEPEFDLFQPRRVCGREVEVNPWIVSRSCRTAVVLGYVGFVHVSVSEARRYSKAQIEKASLESEMAAAREVQRLMVPEDLPRSAAISSKASIGPRRRWAAISSR